jgi:hypothetical protein
MRLAMWAYPWDIHDVGIPDVVDDLKNRAGLNGINIATSYHAGRFFQPRSPKRKTYFPEDGTVYFRPDPRVWEGKAIRPQMAEILESHGDVLAQVLASRDRSGLSVNCWTVCLHNTRLGMLHPGACTHNAFGDPNYYNLCPNHPDVRTYAITLVADLTKRYRPDCVQLESPGFMGFAHGFHHEKDGVGLTPEDDFLLSLCFCDHCLKNAAKVGIDGTRAQQQVRHFIDAAAQRVTPQPRWPDFVASGPDVFADYPAVHRYVLQRFDTVTQLVADIRNAADKATQVLVIDVNNGWLEGHRLPDLSRACDGILLCVYDRSPEMVAHDVAAARREIGADRFLSTGMRVFYPEMQSADDLAIRAAAAARAGAQEVNFYNYGLIPAARLAWINAAARAAQTAQDSHSRVAAGPGFCD